MAQTLLSLTVGPLLVAVASLVTRRYGSRIGGSMSAFPAVVGPVLLVGALGHGARFASDAANGTLLGLVSLAGFAVAYGRAARSRGWRACCAVGWVAAGLTALAVDALVRVLGAPPGVIVAALSLLAAHRAMPDAGPARDLRGRGAPGRGDLPGRMLATAMLTCALSAAADHLGPLVGGMLAALPVLASVLAAFTLREDGPEAAVSLLRGMLAGMAAFVVFCEVVAVLIVQAGTWPAFAVATVAAVAVQTATVHPRVTVTRRRSGADSRRLPATAPES